MMINNNDNNRIKPTNQLKTKASQATNSNETETRELNAFGQSSRTPRSPVMHRGINPFTQSTRTPRSPVNGECSAPNALRLEPSRRNTSRLPSNVFSQLGDQIKSLIDMMEDGKRRSIHQPMRDAIDSIKTLYDKYAGELRDMAAKETDRNDSTSQTSPLMKKQEAKGRQEEIVETPAAKRRTPNPIVLASKIPGVTLKLQKKEGEAKEGPEWQKVTRKKRRKGKKEEEPPKRRKIKPDSSGGQHILRRHL